MSETEREQKNFNLFSKVENDALDGLDDFWGIIVAVAADDQDYPDLDLGLDNMDLDQDYLDLDLSLD